MEAKEGMPTELTECIMDRWKLKNPESTVDDYNPVWSRCYEALWAASEESEEQMLKVVGDLTEELLDQRVELKRRDPEQSAVDAVMNDVTAFNQMTLSAPPKFDPSKMGAGVGGKPGVRHHGLSSNIKAQKARAQRKKMKKHRRRGR